MKRKQRTDEWTNFNEDQLSYHTKQWETPKDSTLAFSKFIKKKLNSSTKVIDIGAGAAAATAFLAKEHANVTFVAADYVKDYLDIGQKMAETKNITNLNFKQVDWYDLEQTDEFDGVVSLQNLSSLPDPKEPLRQVFEKITPQWIALTSLCYEGDISCTIEINEHSVGRKLFYNVYSLPEIQRICSLFGYRLSKFEKFEISIDVEKPDDPNLMGTYTRRAPNEDGSFDRLQVSGPLIMPWYMLLIERE